MGADKQIEHPNKPQINADQYTPMTEIGYSAAEIQGFRDRKVI